MKKQGKKKCLKILTKKTNKYGTVFKIRKLRSCSGMTDHMIVIFIIFPTSTNKHTTIKICYSENTYSGDKNTK